MNITEYWELIFRMFTKLKSKPKHRRITCGCGKTVTRRKDGKPYRHKCALLAKHDKVCNCMDCQFQRAAEKY